MRLWRTRSFLGKILRNAWNHPMAAKKDTVISARDAALTTTEAGLSLINGGGILSALLNQFIPKTWQKRTNEEMECLRNEFQRLDQKIDKNKISSENFHITVLQVRDSVVGLCEIICHVHKSDSPKHHDAKWLTNRCANLARIAPNHMLPSPGVVVNRALREWLKWPKTARIEESKIFLVLRKKIKDDAEFLKSHEVGDAIVKPTLLASKSFYQSLEELSKVFKSDDVVNAQSKVNPLEFKNILIGYVQNKPEVQSNLFHSLMYHHHVGSEVEAAIALEWRKVPYVADLMSIYNLQIGNFIAHSRKAEFSDFLDFELAAYIASNHIDFFVTNNKRDFQEAFKYYAPLANKVLSWEDFKKRMESSNGR